MKAIVHKAYGSAKDVLEIKVVEKPSPNDNEVLVRVYSTTVNRTDCAALRAKPFIMRFVTGLFKPKNQSLGSDFAGEVESIGEKVTSLSPGDRVFGFDDTSGSHCEYVIFPEDKGILTIPEQFSFDEAVACAEGAHYSYNMINKVKIEQGQKMLVNGATGAIGSATVQFLKHLGTHVTAVCGVENTHLVKSLGADVVINYEHQDFTATPEKYNMIFDTVGKSSFRKCQPILEKKGIYISSELGKRSVNVMLALTTPIMGNKKVIFPIPRDIRGSLMFIKKLMESGEFKAVIDRTYDFDQFSQAFDYVETGQKIGNIILKVHSNG